MRRHWAVYLGLAIALTIWCGVDVMVRASIVPGRPELHMTDITVYTEAAKAIFDGRDPYDITNIRGWPYIYPPLFALLIAPLAPLPEPWQAAGWFAISVLCLLGCYRECRRLLDMVRVADDPARPLENQFLAIAFATASLPALNCLQRGQVGVFLLYPLLLGVRLALTERNRFRWILGGMVLMLPVAVKITPALPVGCLGFMLLVQAVFRKHLRPRFAGVTIGVVAGAALYLLVIPSLFVGWNRNLEYLQKFNHNVTSKVNDVRSDDFGGHVASKRNQSLSNAAYRFGNWALARVGAGPDDLLAEQPGARLPMDHPAATWSLIVVRCLAVFGLLATAAIAAFRRDRLALLATFGVAIVATFVVSPVARGHYFLLWIPGSLFLPLWLARQKMTSAALRCAWWPLALCMAHYLFLNQAGRIGLLGLGTTVWYFAATRLLFKSCRQASFIETGDSPEVRAIFVESTLERERRLSRKTGRIPETLKPLSSSPPPGAASPGPAGVVRPDDAEQSPGGPPHAFSPGSRLAPAPSVHSTGRD